MAKIDELIDESIKETKKRLKKIEKAIYQNTLEYYSDNIKTDGDIRAYKTNLVTVNGLKSVLDKGLKAELVLLAKYILDKIDEILKEAIKEVAKIDVRAIEIGKDIQKRLLEHAGLNIEAKANLSNVYEKIKSQSIILLSRQQGISLKDLRETINKTVVKDGIVDQYWSRWTYDIYNQYERAGSNDVRKEVGLKYAIYEGGLIDNSREFCQEKNGKVFTEEEIQAWADEDWPGKNDNYDPIYDCGGYNCRHRLRWISKELAEELRPDLKQ